MKNHAPKRERLGTYPARHSKLAAKGEDAFHVRAYSDSDDVGTTLLCPQDLPNDGYHLGSQGIPHPLAALESLRPY
jgi:hypothetical protein